MIYKRKKLSAMLQLEVIDGDANAFQKDPKDKRGLVFFEGEFVTSLDEKPSEDEALKMAAKIISNDIDVYERKEQENKNMKERRQTLLASMLKVG